MQTKASDERRRQIPERARAAGSIAVSEIAEQLQVAPETVRRDFKTLEEHGLIRRTHGGAYPVDGAAFETSVSRSSEYLLAEKRRIAVAAVTTLDDAATLYLDKGFTPSLVADELIKLKSRLTVVTSSLAVAGKLAPAKSLSVILLGGRLRGGSLATLDHWAIDGPGGVRRETQGGSGIPTSNPGRSGHQVRHEQLLQVC